MTMHLPDSPRTHRSSGRPSKARPDAVLVLAAALMIMLAGCGDTTTESTNEATASSSTAPDGANPTFTLGEYIVKLDRPTLASGKVTISARNDGGETHELVLVRAKAVADLPTKSDGSVDEDKIAESDNVGEIEDIGAHTTKSATFDLEPGTYVAFCNIVDEMGSGMMNGDETPSTMMSGGAAGHVHFAVGMHQLVTVK